MPTFPPLDDALRLARLTPPAGPVRMVLDTDTYNEIDDQFAVVHALGDRDYPAIGADARDERHVREHFDRLVHAQVITAHFLDGGNDHDKSRHRPHEHRDAHQPAEPDVPPGELSHEFLLCHGAVLPRESGSA